MIFRWPDAVEDGDIVVAHVGGAVGARLEIRGRGEESEVEAVAFAEPAIARFHCLQPLLMAHRDAAQHLPIEERTEGADPGVVAESGERLANAHHVGFGDADVQGAILIHRADAGFEAAGGSQVRIHGDDRGIAGEDLHGGGHNFAGGVLFVRNRCAAAGQRHSECACRAGQRGLVITGPTI